MLAVILFFFSSFFLFFLKELIDMLTRTQTDHEKVGVITPIVLTNGTHNNNNNNNNNRKRQPTISCQVSSRQERYIRADRSQSAPICSVSISIVCEAGLDPGYIPPVLSSSHYPSACLPVSVHWATPLLSVGWGGGGWVDYVHNGFLLGVLRYGDPR